MIKAASGGALSLGFAPIDLATNELIEEFAERADALRKQAQQISEPESISLCLLSRDVELALKEAHSRFGGYDECELQTFITSLTTVLALMPAEYPAKTSMASRKEEIAALLRR